MKTNYKKIKIVDNSYFNSINKNIKYDENIKLIGINGEYLGIVSLNIAIEKAKILNLDLIELNIKNKPYIYKIVNYNRFLYFNKKYNKKKNKILYQLKEIKIRFNISTQDLDIKIKNIIKFINKKCKVKVTIKFIGREIIHKNIGINILKYIIEKVKNISNYEIIYNKLDNKQIILILSYK